MDSAKRSPHMPTMGPEQQRLMDRLFGDPDRSVRNFKLTLGDKPSTAEEICAEVNKAMDEVERRRQAGEPDDGPARSSKEPVNVRELSRGRGTFPNVPD